MNFEQLFLDKLGNPTSLDKLKEYIEFVILSQTENEDTYCELHHLLPKSKFPEHIKNLDNIYRLTYENHVKCHMMLFDMYPIPSFYQPMSFMAQTTEERIKVRDLKSKMEIERWKIFKETPEFQTWIRNKSEITTKLMLDGQAKKMSDKRYENPDAKEFISNHFKQMWANSELREWKSIQMIEYKNRPENKEQSSIKSKEMWDNRSPEDSEYQKNLLRKLQKEYNAQTAERNKELWKDPEYKAKMKESRTGISKPNQTKAMKLLWEDPVWKAYMLEQRKLARIKRNETNKS